MLLYRFLPLVALIAQGFLLFLVLRVKRKSAVHWVFCVFLGSMSLWGLFIFGFRNSANLGQAMVWEQILLPTLVAASYSFFFFTVLFTRRSLSGKAIVGVSVLAGFLVGLSLTPLVLKGIQLRPFGYAIVIGPLWFLWIAGIYLALFLSFYYLYHFYKTSTSADDRNRSLYVLAGILATFIGGTSDYIAAMGWLPQPGGIYGNLVFATLATVAVVRHRLIDAHLYLRRGLAYTLVSATVLLPYVGFIIIWNRVFRIQEIPLWTNIFLILGIASGLHFLLRHFQEMVDRWFIGARYSAVQTLREFSRTATHTLDSQELHSSMIQIIAKAMGIDIVHILLYSPEKGSLGLALSSRLDPQSYPVFRDKSPLLMWLRDWEGAVDRDSIHQIPVLQGLSAYSLQTLDKMQGEVFIPLKTQERLVGLLVLGPRNSRIPYSSEDVNLLVTVSNQAAMALENARLYTIERERVAQLQAITQMKAGFLMTVAHQLKTPLTAIKASAGMLQEVIGEKATTSQKRLLVNVDRGIQSLETEIGKLLEFLKIKTADIKINMETVDIRDIIRQTTDQVLPSIQAKKQNLNVDMPEAPVLARLDRSKVEAILLNLIGNANKFTPEKGKIEIQLEKTDSYVIVGIKDSGPGIAPPQLEHIFDSFYEVKDGGGGSPGSSGLGLAIAKSLVELHGGKIWVDSTVGVSSTFYFSLPLEQVI